MSLIDNTYFVGEYKIGNLTSGTNPVVTVKSADLAWFIAKYEKDLLIKIMGETMYDQFMAGLLEDPILDKWADLRDELRDATNKVSPIAAYVWYAYRMDQLTQSGMFGETAANMENATLASSQRKMIDAWNFANSEAYDVAVWIDEHPTDYPDREIDLSLFYTMNDFNI